MHKICRLMMVSVLFLALPVFAQKGAAALIQNVGVDQKLGVQVPLDLTFTTREGKNVKLDELLDSDKVTILVPVYYSCPGICTAVLGSVTRIIDEMRLDLGKDYQIINVSFDPTNTPEMAKEKAENYRSALSSSKREAARDSWYFLTGTQSNIDTLMNQIGFRYEKIDGEFSHAAVLVALTPDGKIARYLTGVGISPDDTRLAIIEASDGKVGSPIDLVYSYCYRYDPTAGKYVPLAWRIMRIGCLTALGLMLIGGSILWKSELVRKRRLEHNV